MGWRIGMMAVSMLALAACSKPAEKAASAEGAGKAATATAPSATTMPARKPGLWKQTVSTAGMQQSSSLCLDKDTEAKLSVWGAGAAKDTCQKTEIAPVAGGWSFKSSCDMGSGGQTTSEGTVTGDFNTAYKVEATSHTEGAGAPQMNGEHKMSMEAVWQGPCPADMKPGDMALANGMKFNMLEMAAGHPPTMHMPGKK